MLIEVELDAGRLPDLAILRERFGPNPARVPAIKVTFVPLSAYDESGPPLCVWALFVPGVSRGVRLRCARD